jgi:hypothetical protein
MISEIKRLMDEQHEAVTRCDRSQQYAVAAAYDREIEKRQQAAQKAFARRNGWIVTQSLIGAERLIPREKRPEGTWWGWGRFVGAVSDHDFACREPKRPYRITAVVCQPYNDRVAEAEAVAERLGLAVCVPPDPRASIWHPGSTQFIVFTRPGVEVRWLKEQIEWKQVEKTPDED